ncbi:MAG: hypothetical protein A2X59_13460 [Nitrospirae bacterium GWC2_42_7]|nr:MAG: hypothetical protein A2X59_13460 [Nitrospirae bacterium GWC2_42_7]
MISKKLVSLLLLILSLLSFSSPVSAMSEEEKSFLNMYFTEEELQVVSATRSLQSITRVAENISVVTKEDIELMNAHTLADVVSRITGVQISPVGGIGSPAMIGIQGSEIGHVAVFMDGVFLGDLMSNYTDVATLPVQHVEKVEIIKGPASSTWGSSLGGVINIITKSPEQKKTFSGSLYSSYGERQTADVSAELSGKTDRFGYYFSAGNLRSDGFIPSTGLHRNNIYSKFTFDLTDKSRLTFSLYYNMGETGLGESKGYDFIDHFTDESLAARLLYESSLTDDLSLRFSLKSYNLNTKYISDTFGSGQFFDNNNQNKYYGTNAELIWKPAGHTIVLGTDYEKKRLEVDYKYTFWGMRTTETEKTDKWSVFVNDTITWDKLTIIPGLRYDHLENNEGFLSPSLGMTYELFSKTILRVNVSRGFNSPTLFNLKIDDPGWGTKSNPDLNTEKIWSYQCGFETGELKYVWLKVSLFRHVIKDAIVWKAITDPVYFYTVENETKQRRQGIEIEFRTMPIYNFTLYGGAAFIDYKELENRPTQTFDIGLKYDDKKSFRALLHGHYIWLDWPKVDKDFSADYNSFVFDVNMIKKFYEKKDFSVEGFVTGHNIFNAAQYTSGYLKNSGRWIESGVRMKF